MRPLRRNPHVAMLHQLLIWSALKMVSQPNGSLDIL